MRAVVRSNLGSVTLLLSAGALGVVFAAVFRVIPAGPVPRSAMLLSLVPHLNAVVSLAAIGTILSGVHTIRQGNVASHRRFMLTSTGLFATFLVLYLYKLVLEGQTTFAGPATVDQVVYLPLLAVHVLLAIVAVPLVIYVLLLAGTYPVNELPDTPHPRVGRLAAALWLVSFALGEIVYLLLYVLY